MTSLTDRYSNDMSRRNMLIALAAAGLTGCQTTQFGNARETRSAKPVNLALSQFDRSIVGLRPGRSGGFRLDIENTLGKVIVHNYGHGGDGYTLSWPCARWTANQIMNAMPDSVAILGAGVSGLTTAWLLAKRGIPVSIYSDRYSPDTTSNIAGAIVLTGPTYRSGSNSLTGPTDSDINAQVYDGFLPFVGSSRYAVCWIDHFQMRPKIADNVNGGDQFLGRIVTRKLRTIMIDPTHYMTALMQDLKEMGVTFFTKNFLDQSQIAQLPEKVIANCIGLGARDLFVDNKMYPIRGQLTLLKAQSLIDYSYISRQPGGILYMFPRRDHIVLGGSSESGNSDLEPRPIEMQRQMDGHRKLMKNLNGAPILDPT
ncbi:MAG: FAD-dependent oxidoreductase [Sphingorhabdus sp.]